MNEIRYWLDKELDDDTRASIIFLKQQHWPYSFESQREWMRDNIAADDIHFCLYHKGNLVSYLTLSNVEVSINGAAEQRLLGLGNVCTGKQYLHRGFASELIKDAQRYICNQDAGAILLCHGELEDFYRKLNWMNISNQCSGIKVAGKAYTLVLMQYNFALPTAKVEIVINKNF